MSPTHAAFVHTNYMRYFVGLYVTYLCRLVFSRRTIHSVSPLPFFVIVLSILNALKLLSLSELFCAKLV